MPAGFRAAVIIHAERAGLSHNSPANRQAADSAVSAAGGKGGHGRRRVLCVCQDLHGPTRTDLPSGLGREIVRGGARAAAEGQSRAGRSKLRAAVPTAGERVSAYRRSLNT